MYKGYTKYPVNAGEVYGFLTVITPKAKFAECRCVCGNIKDIRTHHLAHRNIRSCGCKQGTQVGEARTHGLSRTVEYKTWKLVKDRCFNPKSTVYRFYGGRGISMYEGWVHDPVAFIQYIGPRPTPKHSIDRINSNKGYEPGNLRWATKDVQASNMRSNRYIEYKGERYTYAQFIRAFGVSNGRIYKWLTVRKVSNEEFLKQIGFVQ